MVTLKVIADHLNLSESTVSRVLNGRGRVSQATRDAVIAYAKEVDYHPNQLALGLKKQRANAVGVVLPDISNDYHVQFFRSVDQRLREAGKVTMLFDAQEDPAREEDFLSYLHSSVVDNLIVATSGSESYSRLPKALLDRIVFVDNRPVDETRDIMMIESDNFSAAEVLTEHVIDRGHPQVATVTGPLTESTARNRLDGVRATLKKHGLELREEWVFGTNFLYEEGYQAAKQMLSQPGRPTAVIAQNNVLAYAILRACEEQGLRVPDDVAVACFDHIDTYRFIRPEITSVVQPPANMAIEATNALLALEKDPKTPKKTVILRAEFREGETT